MEFYGDYHLHSSYSDGRCSVEEMVMAASLTGLAEMGLADHGPRNLFTGLKSEQMLLEIKKEIEQLRPQYPDLQIKLGVEANIVSLNGQLDVGKELIAELDFLIVGLHPYILPDRVVDIPWILRNQTEKIFPSIKNRVRNENTKALVETIYRYEVDIISHPGLKMPIDITEVARACLKRDTCWEINTGHKFPGLQEVSTVARQGVNFIVNSDAHFAESVGALEYGSWVLEKAGVPHEQIKNVK
ncbi:MAG: PHP domain-containing protein [Clostridia bacterium]|nr:PHP domain-containing protein [Clostridia bacterium]